MGYKRDMPTQIAWVKTRLATFLQSKLYFPVEIPDDVANIIAQKRVFGGESVWLKGEERQDIQLKLVINSPQKRKQSLEQQSQTITDDCQEQLEVSLPNYAEHFRQRFLSQN